ncbi:recombination mediator RecR [Candidatus Gracilibacteria bacterium]|nr:recombination mediator RecR [Candidatus Gracilibacteria bacterium]
MNQKIVAEPLQKIIDNFKSLPGIGEKTAQKLAFFSVKQSEDFLGEFGKNFSDLKKNITECEKCCNFTEKNPNEEKNFCEFCKKIGRDEKILCVVENPFDIFPIEKSGIFKGFYHILHGVISPIDGIFAENLRIGKLLERLKNENFEEIILAINPSLEGEATAIYISRKIQEMGVSVKITALAKGISVGGDLEYTDELTVKKSLENRVNV